MSTEGGAITYHLGIDLGTTYTSAAISRGGRTEIANLGNRSPVIPSVVFLRDDGEVLVGEAAERRVEAEPDRVAREFKRRIGDPTPVVLGGAPCAPDLLTAKLLRWVVDKVAEAEGGPADHIAVTHPANWGPFKTDLLHQAIRRADLDTVELISEPEAAAIHYASQERVPPGSTVAVYDLGGGTFDAAILRRTDTGWDIVGTPEGIEHLGGIDFDAAIFEHVMAAIGERADQLDLDDPTLVPMMTRLRRDCVAAKEALSADTDVSIPVLLPELRTEVRLTRVELEDMVRPALRESTAALERTLRSAGLDVADVAKVLLVGGSSRIPLVAQLVSSELRRPVAVDAHPKHGVALGAALVAAQAAGAAQAAEPEPQAAPEQDEPTVEAPLAHEPVVATVATPAVSPSDSPAVPSPAGASTSEHSNLPAFLLLGGAVVALVVLVFVVTSMLSGDGDDDDDDTAAVGSTTQPSNQNTNGTSADAIGSTRDGLETRSPDQQEPEQESPTTSETPVTEVAATNGELDLLANDATPAFNAFGTLGGEDPRVLEISLYPSYAFIAVQNRDEPEYADRYQWMGGDGLGAPDDWSAFFNDPSELFNLSEVDPSRIPEMSSRALQEITGNGMELTHIIIGRSFSADDQVTVNIYVSNPERSNSGGYVSFSLDGTHIRTVA